MIVNESSLVWDGKTKSRGPMRAEKGLPLLYPVTRYWRAGLEGVKL